MPSSYYSGEKLTADIVKTVLRLLLETENTKRDRVVKTVSSNFHDHTDPSLVKTETQRLIRYLKYRGYIDETDDQLAATDKGINRLMKLHMDELRLAPDQEWDGMWRILTFDIPEQQRPARDMVRGLIRRMGFMQLHKSVWVHPLPCREYVQQIQDAYGVHDHITLLEVNTFDQEAYFRQQFERFINLQ